MVYSELVTKQPSLR